MKQLFAISDSFLKQSNWTTIALLKICLLSMGVILGFAVPAQHKKWVLILASGLFTITYIPLMKQLLHVFIKDKTEK